MSNYVCRAFMMLLLLCGVQVKAMVYDNRYVPLIFKHFIRRPGAIVHTQFQPYFFRADRSFGDFDEFGYPEFNGRYNLAEIARALVENGTFSSSPVRSDYRGISQINFNREGRLDAEGLAFFYERFLTCNLAVGTSMLFMHANSRHEFLFENDCLPFPDLGPGDRTYFFLLKDKLNRALGVTPPLWSKTAFGDADIYLRYGLAWDYTLKFRRIDVGLKLGMLAPIAPPAPLDNPAGFAIGGDRHWGIYGEAIVDFELKEDWFFSLLGRVSKRFARTQIKRMPVFTEPTNYGAVVGPLRTDPGVTIAFAPIATIEGLRDGLGAKLQYTLIHHFKDKLEDKRNDKSVPVHLDPVEARSSWGSDYVTASVFYDFAKMRDCRWYLPTVTAALDIPVPGRLAERSAKTYGISLLLETNY